LSKLCALFGFLVKAGGEFSLRSKLAATVAAVALVIALGVVDYVTGRELVISAFYLLPTLLGMGGRAFTGIGCRSFVHMCMVCQ
jgi:hypothetical protein